MEAVAASYFQLGGSFFTRCRMNFVSCFAPNLKSHLEVSGQAMNSAFHKDESEFAVFVFSVLLQMFPHLDSFLDEMIEIFRDLWCETIHSENAKNLVFGDGPDLSNSMLIPGITHYSQVTSQ